MSQEYRAICKDCGVEFGYSEGSLLSGGVRGLSRPERCPGCRRTHSREGQSIGVPQITLKPTGPRKPDSELSPGRLGRISHPERPHRKVVVEGKFVKPESKIEFGITDEDIRHLIETMQTRQVTVVVGPTGSGKSTFLPYRLMAPPEGIEPDIFTRYGQIVVTQPRIPATRNIARFVSEDLHGSSLGAGFDVGFRHSNAPASDWRNKLVYVTDGTLINWIVGGQISNLSVIMIDEAHERSLNIDLILGLLKQQLPRFPHLRLIIASATINADLFCDYFGGAERVGLLKFKGLKQHTVDAFFPDHDERLANNHRVPFVMASKIEDILLSIARGQRPEGDILGFLPGESAIETCVGRLRESVVEQPELRNLGINVYPLYSQLPQELQDLALSKKIHAVRDKILGLVRGDPGVDRIFALFLDHKAALECAELVGKELEEAGIDGWVLATLGPIKGEFDSFPRQVVFTTHEDFPHLRQKDGWKLVTDRRVIISTNLAETSLTVDGIVYVVDSGLIKEKKWDAENLADDLKPIFHSRAGCRQRWGRAGRVRDGETHLLYTDAQFEDDDVFSAYSVPEIQRSSLEQVVLRAKAAGIDDIQNFDWLQRPPETELQRAPKALQRIGALDEDGDLTEYGTELDSISMDIPIADLFVAADQYACGVEMATLVAMASLRTTGGLMHWDRNWDFPTRYGVEEIRKGLSANCFDDLEFYLKMYSIWAEAETEKERDRLCSLFFINQDQLTRRVLPKRNGFLEMLSIGKKSSEDRPINYGQLDRLRMVLAVFLQEEFIYEKSDPDGKIEPWGGSSPNDALLQIDEDSTLAHGTPPLFLSLKRRISRTREGGKRIGLSSLVRVKREWLQCRESSTLSLARAISKELAPKIVPEKLGLDRHRLFLDVRYPLGTRFLSETDASGDVILKSKTFDPSPIIPRVADGKLHSPEEILEKESEDASPTAGWEDKLDKTIGYESLEGEDFPDNVSADSEEEDTEVTSGSEDSLELMDHTGAVQVGISASPVKTAEMEAAETMLPSTRYEEYGLSGRGGLRDQAVGSERPFDEFEVIGHDFGGAKPVVMVRPYTREQKGGAGTLLGLNPGALVDVEAISVIEAPNGEKALKVREKATGFHFLVDSGDLSFSEVWSVVDEYANREFPMVVVNVGEVDRRLTCLPLFESCLQKLVKTPFQPLKGRFFCSIGFKDFFVMTGPDIPEEIVLLGRMKKSSGRRPFERGADHTFELDPRTGEARIHMAVQPEGLLPFVEKEKFRRRIFWNVPELRLHTKEPMSEETRGKLLEISTDPYYRSCIQSLYRLSNELRIRSRSRFKGRADDMFTAKLNVPVDVVGLLSKERIRRIEVETGCTINHPGDGVFVIKSEGGKNGLKAVDMIKGQIPEAERYKGPLSIGKSWRDQFFKERTGPYRDGQILCGRVAKIFEWGVSVVLDEGGVGKIPIAHLSWRRLLDPREVVYPDQRIKAGITAIEGRSIYLTLLYDFSSSPITSKYREGTLHKAVISIVKEKYAVAELEPGVTGIASMESGDAHATLQPGQKINVRVISARIDYRDRGQPVKITLSPSKESITIHSH